LPFWAGL